MSEYFCGGTCNDGSTCEHTVSEPNARCHQHPKEVRADGGVAVANSGGEGPGLSTGPVEDAAVSLASCGDALRSFFRLPAVLVDECKLRFDEDGMHVKVVDAPNVAMLNVSFPADMFGRYDLDGDSATVGLNLKRLRKTLRWARKGRGDADGDPVLFDYLPSAERLRVRVVREDNRMVRRSEWGAIDPDDLRSEPDVPNLELPNRARPGIGALGDALDAVDAADDHVEVTRDSSTLVLHGDGDYSHERVMLNGAAWDTRPDAEAAPCTSLFSLDYMDDMVDALAKADADSLTLKWGNEFPTKLSFLNEKWSVEGEFMLAPRIQTTDGGDA